jgi:hypothetical protein
LRHLHYRGAIPARRWMRIVRQNYFPLPLPVADAALLKPLYFHAAYLSFLRLICRHSRHFPFLSLSVSSLYFLIHISDIIAIRRLSYFLVLQRHVHCLFTTAFDERYYCFSLISVFFAYYATHISPLLNISSRHTMPLVI